MNTDTPLAQLRYFLPDDLYLLNADKDAYRSSQQQPGTIETTPATGPAMVETANATAPATAPAPAPTTASASATVPTAPVKAETPAPTFKYTGLNQKHFLILCHYPAGPQMADAHLTALINTITRIGFTQNDVAILNLAQYPQTTWTELTHFFKPQKLLVLGTDALPAALPPLGQNQTQQVNGCQLLYTFSFDEMMGNKESTKAFWNQIKTF